MIDKAVRKDELIRLNNSKLLNVTAIFGEHG